MRTKQQLNPEQAFLLETAFGHLAVAQRAREQARLELGSVMRLIGLSASARHLKKSKQWALEMAQRAEGTRSGGTPLGVADLAEYIRRLGVLEPITAEVVGDGALLVTDGRRRLQAVREAGISSLPVMLTLVARSTDQGEGGSLGDPGARGTRTGGANYVKELHEWAARRDPETESPAAR